MKYSEITDDLREKVRQDADRRLGPEELEAYVSAPITDAERDEVLSLVRWFRRRYPTALDRLAYIRQAARRARR